MDSFAEWLLSPTVIGSVIALIGGIIALTIIEAAKIFKKENCCPKCKSWETDEVVVVRIYHVGADGLSVFFGTNHAKSSEHKRWCRGCGYVLIDQLHSTRKLPEPSANVTGSPTGGNTTYVI